MSTEKTGVESRLHDDDNGPIPGEVYPPSGTRDEQSLRALLIPADPEAPIHTVQVTGNSDGDQLASMQALVGGHIELVAFPGHDDVAAYINEDGKHIGLAPNPRACKLLARALAFGDWIAGDCLLVGNDERTGALTALPADVSLGLASLAVLTEHDQSGTI